MELTDVVKLVVRPCGDCFHSEILRTKCIFGSSSLTDLNDTQLYKKLRGTFVRECQAPNVYYEIPHVDSLECLNVDDPVRTVKSDSKKLVNIDDVCQECEKKVFRVIMQKRLFQKLKVGVIC